MYRLKPLIILLLLTASILPATGQYQFDSKKDQKLYNQMEEYYADYNYEGILENEDAVTQAFLSKEDTLTALMYDFLAEAYVEWNGDLEKGLELYEKAHALRMTLQPDDDHKNLIFMLAYLNDELGDYEESERLYIDLLEQDEKASGKKSEEYFITASSLLDHYINTYQPKAGLELADDVKKSVKRNTYNEALLLRAYSDLYLQRGEFKNAEKNILKAIEILEETGYYPSLEYVYFLNTLAFIYIDNGRLALVEDIFDNSLSMLNRLQGDYEEDEITIKNNLAQLYINLGNHPKADELMQEVLAFDRDYYGEESFSYGLTNYNLGLNSFHAGNFEAAETYTTTAMEVFRNSVGEDNINYARALNQLAGTYTKMGYYQEAEEYATKSLAAHQEAVGESDPEFAWPLQVMGTVYQHTGDLDKAKDFHKRSLDVRAKRLGTTHPAYAKSARLLAIDHWQAEEMDDALDYYDKAFENYFAQINTFFPVLSEDEKSKFYYTNLKPTFEQFNSFIVENKSEDQELIELMYNYQLSTKGLILYATNKVRESIVNSNDSSLINKYDTWISQKEQLAQLFSAGDMDPDERKEKIAELMETSNELEAELSQLSTAFASNFASRDLTWKDVQEKLKPGEAAVEIIRFRDFDPEYGGTYTDEVYYAALIVTTETEGAPKLVIMRNGKEMETKYLANYRNAIKYQVNENFSYRLYWRPIANQLEGIKKIYFSPDGVFNQISIYTLQNPATKKFTIDEFEIQLVTNTKDLVAYNFEQKSNFSSDSYLFGYPNYNMGSGETEEAGNSGGAENRGMTRGARGARGSEADLQKLTKSGSLPRGIRGNLLRYMRSDQGLALLPGTQKEINLIEDLYSDKNASTTVYMSDEAIEEQIKDVSNPQTLHIATHGFFLEHEEKEGSDSKDPYVSNPLLRSGLIMAGANSYIKNGEIISDKELEDDGILTAYEAMNLNLDDTELVVLSACETGLGEVQNGEGVFGLQRAFQIAGAEAVIMSMWTVDDDATQELMTNFYEEWLTTGDKHKSFITAQKRLKEKRSSPYYWGAFVMVGN